MKNVSRSIFALALTAALGTSVAFATTVGIAYDNVGINLGGPGITLPGGKLSVSQSLGMGMTASGSFVGAGGRFDSTFYGLNAALAKDYPVLGGKLMPSVNLGFNRLNTGPMSAEAAYAGVGLGYAYPLTKEVSLGVDGGFGRDFATSVTDAQTFGGLAYNAGAEAAFKLGPGCVDAGYQYRHLPLDGSVGLNTNEFTIGYAMMF